jgi:hypothetical protein
VLCGILQPVGAQLTIDVSRRLVVHTFSGELGDADIADLPLRVRSHPDFDPTFSELLDFSGVTAGTVSSPVLDAVARSKSSFSPASFHVVIARMITFLDWPAWRKCSQGKRGRTAPWCEPWRKPVRFWV